MPKYLHQQYRCWNEQDIDIRELLHAILLKNNPFSPRKFTTKHSEYINPEHRGYNIQNDADISELTQWSTIQWTTRFQQINSP